MATAFKHKRYFKVATQPDGSAWLTFSSTDDAKAKIGFKACWSEGTPTTTYALADSDTTLVCTYEFGSASDQTTFKSAVDAAFDDGLPWTYEDRDFIDDGKNYKIKDGKPGAGTVIDMSDSASGSHTNRDDPPVTLTGQKARLCIGRQTATGKVGVNAQDAAEAFWMRKPAHIKTEWLKTDGATIESTLTVDNSSYFG